MALKFTRLTRPNIRALKPGERIAEHGITAERLPSGDLKYTVNVMMDRQRVHRVIGRDSEGVTRKQAEEFIEKVRTEAREGRRTRMDRPFRRAVIRAGLDPAKITPHVMRHTAITNLVQSGADLPTIQRISGHKTLSMVMRYTHVHGQHIDRAIRAIGRALPEPSENKNAGTVTQE